MIIKIKKALIFFTFVLGLAILFGNGSGLAAEPRLIGTHGDWNAYMFWENGNKVCFMASQPKKSEGNYTRRGDVFALITHRPDEKTTNVVSVITGYDYKTGSDVTVKVNGKKFTLFTQGDTAWTRDSKTDSALVNAVRSGNALVVKGTSSRGTLTKDTFGLKGSMAAHQAISRECNVKG